MANNKRDDYEFTTRIIESLRKFRDSTDPFSTVVKKRVFMRQNCNGPSFLSSKYNGENTRDEWVKHPEDALDYTGCADSYIISTYSKHCKQDDKYFYCYVDLEVEHKFIPVSLNTPEMIDALRQQALRKLSLPEIQALGAEPIAIYYKLKDHKVDDV